MTGQKLCSIRFLFMKNICVKKIEVTPFLDVTTKSSPEATSDTGAASPSIDSNINDIECNVKGSVLISMISVSNVTITSPEPTSDNARVSSDLSPNSMDRYYNGAKNSSCAVQTWLIVQLGR